MAMDKPSIWKAVRTERARLVADLQNLPREAWLTPSLCPGWTVHDVLAHLVDSATTSRWGFVRRLVASRFDFDADNALGVARQKRDDPLDTLEAMRSAISLTLTPPAPRATRLVEAFVHGEDIRRPLGIEADYPVDAVTTALAHQAKTSVAMGGGRERIREICLVATEDGTRIGAGPEVRGRAIDLLVAVSGRPITSATFDGPAVARLLAPI